MNVVDCDDTRRVEWDRFVESAPGAAFYHRYAWRDINRAELGHRSFYLAAVDGRRIVGILPVVQVKSRLFGNIGCSMPFVNFGGPCGESVDAEQALIQAAGRLVEQERLDYLEMRNPRRIDGDLPTSEHKVSMTLDLDRDPDVLWRGFKTGHRQDIRKGYKHGLVARHGGADLLDAFYEVLSESWHQLGTPFYRKSYFSSILRTFPTNCRICVVFAGEVPAAAAFDGLHGDTVEGMWLGSRATYRSQMAGYVLYWELIKNACERGFRRFHLGRSTSEGGGETYKKKWNAYATQLYWQYLLGTRRSMPALNVDNPRYRFARRAWQRLPAAVTRWLGPHVARSIP